MAESIFKRELPELEKQFGAFAKKALEDGALSGKVKELIAAALSVAVKCEPCLEHHLKRALGKGASSREIAEALGVALLMVGGPASAWPMKAVDKVLGGRGRKETPQSTRETPGGHVRGDRTGMKGSHRR